MESKKDAVLFLVLFSPLFSIIAFGLSYSSKAPQKVTYALFLIACIATIASNVAMLYEQECYESSAILNAVYTFVFILISTYKMFKIQTKQALYSYTTLATAAVAFGFSLYFLTQIRLHPKVKG